MEVVRSLDATLEYLQNYLVRMNIHLVGHAKAKFATKMLSRVFMCRLPYLLHSVFPFAAL